MALRQLDCVMRRLRSGLLGTRDCGDGPLLERYVTQRENAAFEALVRRHGPMVFGVCRRVLCNVHDAEDAFQATFLVLVRKAASIRPRDQVGHWLYGVACRTALKAKTMVAKRAVRERTMPRKEVVHDEPAADWLPLLDQEISQLPDKYRMPVVLCDLEGKLQREAARVLGWPEGTVSTRLRRGRVLLAQRLQRRGVELSGHVPPVTVSPLLVTVTVQAAACFAAGQFGVAGAASANVVALTEGVLKTMLLSKLKPVLAAVLLMVGVGAVLHQSISTAASAQGADKTADHKTRVRVIGVDQSKTAHGMTAPGEGWQPYANGSGIYIDVDTSAAKFKSVPTYITSLGGNNGHWMVTGISAIYPRLDKDRNELPLETGFRIYLRFPEDPENVYPECQKKYYVNWVAYGE